MSELDKHKLLQILKDLKNSLEESRSKIDFLHYSMYKDPGHCLDKNLGETRDNIVSSTLAIDSFIEKIEKSNPCLEKAIIDFNDFLEKRRRI